MTEGPSGQWQKLIKDEMLEEYLPEDLNDERTIYDKRIKWTPAKMIKDQMLEAEMAKDKMEEDEMEINHKIINKSKTKQITTKDSATENREHTALLWQKEVGP